MKTRKYLLVYMMLSCCIMALYGTAFEYVGEGLIFEEDLVRDGFIQLDSDYGEEEICIGNHCLYLYLPRTAKRKKLNTNYLEKLFGVDLTMRKLNVVEKLLTK